MVDASLQARNKYTRDMIALTNIPRADKAAGTAASTMVSASKCPEGGDDDIRNIFIRQVAGYSRGGHHVVRFLNADGLRIYNVVHRQSPP